MNNHSKTIATLIITVLLAWASHPAAAQTTFSEPATVFYGKVIGTGSARPFIIHEGNIAWTITRHDGTDVNLSATMYKLEDGTYSYRLNLPHSALALGLSSSVGGIPLPPVPEIHTHKSVSVNGQAAALLGPATSTFSTEQLLRTATYRMDLAVGAAAVDSDGDGIPDWWEDEHGLDKQDASDAGSQRSGDGTTALNAYLNGLDPNHDHRRPELITDEVVVYMSGLTAVLLNAVDQNSTPAQITYEITSLPNAGAIVLRNANSNPSAPDQALGVGATFTQEDVLKSRLVYRPDMSGSEPGVFGVKVRDEQNTTASDEGTIRLLGFNAPDSVAAQATATEKQRIANDEYAARGFVVADAANLSTNAQLSAPSAGLSGAALAAFNASYGQDKSHLLLAGAGSNIRVAGGQSADELVVGSGRGTLAGGAGGDRFVMKDLRTGRLTIEDFSKANVDILDFSALPAATAGRYAHHYLRFTNVAGVSELRVDLDGDGVGYTNLAVALPGLASTNADLYALFADGNLVAGTLALQPRVSISAAIAGASENGPTAGRFVLRREGSLAGDLTVNLTISGTAVNGSDYGLIASSIVIPAGQSELAIDVLPYVDGITEVNETVTLGISANAAYAIGSSAQASVTISDQMMVVKIEAVDTLAVKDTQIPATFLVTRRDVIDRDVLVRLQITGTAANGIDYNTIGTSLLLPRGQSMALITVTPKAAAVLAGGMETVIVTIRTDAAYLIEPGLNTAQVSIIERQDSFQTWMARAFPDAGGMSPSDAPGSSIPLIQRYAYGLDPAQPDPAGLPRITAQADGTMLLSFRKPLSVQDISYRVSAASNLMNWGGSSIGLEPVAAPAGNTDPQRVYYRLSGAPDASAVFTVIELDWVE